MIFRLLCCLIIASSAVSCSHCGRREIQFVTNPIPNEALHAHLEKLFNDSQTEVIPEAIWLATPSHGGKSPIEDLYALAERETRRVDLTHYILRGRLNAQTVYSLLSLSVYPDGVQRLIKIAESQGE